ncbi:MAG: CotH kinase family protein [Candidatus Omnitrophota bacterium]
MIRKFLFLLLIALMAATDSYSDVVINEIAYNPTDIQYEAGSLREFIELYNPGPSAVDLSGYVFSNGITYVFPAETKLLADSYLVVVSSPTHSSWKGKNYQILGPYEGRLSNSGERLTLSRSDGTRVDSVKYSDFFPWPRTPDGYGLTLERIAWDLPSEDFHSWRASLFGDGTPGTINSITGTLPRPVITAYEVSPRHPTSKDAVTVRFGFDAADTIDSATIHWEIAEQRSTGGGNEPAFLAIGYDIWRYWTGRQLEPSEGLEWTQTDFDDSSWKQGPGGHGYSIGDMVGTRLSDMRRRYSTVYVRQDFNLTDPTILESVYLYVFYTGGYVCYINGVEVSRMNAPDVAAYDSLATGSHDVNDPAVLELTDTQRFLQKGKNVISLVGLNYNLDANSFVIAAFLLEGRKSSTAVESTSLPMTKAAGLLQSATYEAVIPPYPSQTLIRFNAELLLTNGRLLKLPHVAELRPFESYFVYDGEIDSNLPVLWLYEPVTTALPEISRSVGGAVILPAGDKDPLVFDGAIVTSSRNGQKLKFLKGEEFRGDRTLNISPETTNAYTTAGPSSSFREWMGHWFFREMGVPSPRAEWFRVINGKQSSGAEQTQQLLVQQVNERFLEMNGFNPNGDLYKRNYVSPNWEKHTNLEGGVTSMNDLVKSMRPRDPLELRAAIENNLAVDEFMAYTVASVLTSNWDGFHNNHWMYLDPDAKKWWIFPWDLDKVWGYTDSNSMFVEMPLNFPLDGRAAHAAREPGPITGILQKDAQFREEYIKNLRIEMSRAFAADKLYAKIGEMRSFLLEDLDKLEKQIGQKRDDRRKQITDSCKTIETFIDLRRAFLDKVLPTPVDDWQVY